MFEILKVSSPKVRCILEIPKVLSPKTRHVVLGVDQKHGPTGRFLAVMIYFTGTTHVVGAENLRHWRRSKTLAQRR